MALQHWFIIKIYACNRRQCSERNDILFLKGGGQVIRGNEKLLRL